MTQATITLDSVVSQSPELVATDIDGQTAILSIQSGAYFGLDGVGTRIWSLLVQPEKVNRLCECLLGEYHVERTQCEQQVLAFLQKMAEANLLNVQDATPQ